jgi:hypothetical protein
VLHRKFSFKGMLEHQVWVRYRPKGPSSGQCCGSETIYSASDLEKVPGLYLDPNPYHICHTIYKEFWTRSCLFMLEVALLSREFSPHFLFLPRKKCTFWKQKKWKSTYNYFLHSHVRYWYRLDSKTPVVVIFYKKKKKL